MTINNAVRDRINQILEEKKTTWYKLYKSSGLSDGTIAGIHYLKNKSVDLKTIVTITRTLGVSITEFFNSPIFCDTNIDEQ